MSQPTKIVKNASKGYGYTYSNLADLAKAGIEIPPMKTEVVNGQEYVFAYVNGDWIQGAKVVDVEMKGMNAAQAYGSALTYARRYTVQLVMAIACDDDDKLEAHTADDRKSAQQKQEYSGKFDFQALRDEVAIIDDVDSLQDIYKRIMADKPSPAQQKYINSIINKRKKELTQ